MLKRKTMNTDRLAIEIISLAIKEYKDILQGELWFKEIWAKATPFDPPYKHPIGKKQVSTNAGARVRWSSDEGSRIALEYAEQGIKVTPKLCSKVLNGKYFTVLKNGRLSIDGYSIKKLDNFFYSEWCETLLYVCNSSLSGADIVKMLHEKYEGIVIISGEKRDKYIARIKFLAEIRKAKRRRAKNDDKRDFREIKGC